MNKENKQINTMNGGFLSPVIRSLLSAIRYLSSVHCLPRRSLLSSVAFRRRRIAKAGPLSSGFRLLVSDTGFTLIELVMTIVILGFSSLIIVPFFQAITSSPDPMIRQRSIALGQAMMDEILAKRWDENTPIGGGPVCTATESGTGRGNGSYTLDCATETTRIASAIGLDLADGDAAADRTTWDDVDDYNYLSLAGGNYEDGTFTDQAGATLSFPGFKRWVEIDYIAGSTAVTEINKTTPAASGQGSADSTDSKRIVVQVQAPTGQIYTFVAVSCNF